MYRDTIQKKGGRHVERINQPVHVRINEDHEAPMCEPDKRIELIQDISTLTEDECKIVIRLLTFLLA